MEAHIPRLLCCGARMEANLPGTSRSSGFFYLLAIVTPMGGYYI